MPGDTKIHKTNKGWIDDDDPNTYYAVRELARDARRAKNKTQPQKTKSHPPKKTKVTTFTSVGFKHTTTGLPASSQSLTSLQNRLYTRLTKKQGVPDVDAVTVITSNGYNKAASYGHMRAAGATDSEAIIVIGLNSPTVSHAYGKGRASGLDHTKALSEALKCQASA